ncbi:NifU family protein [Sodalis-like secondary symbiont of Drepanosiphum platanoidis]|uniref:NifU family protein n=1 Tax=Sodalis-like secondary symbiont of Drepanosiphum platanoidis TaxID=2994493 RepID=UPI003464B7FB
MIYITKSAQKYIKNILSSKKEKTNIRIFIKNLKTSYMKYGMSFCLKNEIKKNDIKFKFKYFSIFVNKKISPYIKNLEINFVKNDVKSYLTIKAPYIKKYNKFNSIDLFNKIKDFLNLKININLSKHGGKVELIKITKNMFAILKFSGGCQGCSMIKITLKNNIEKNLLKFFPQLNGISDSTNHIHKKFSYY